MTFRKSLHNTLKYTRMRSGNPCAIHLCPVWITLEGVFIMNAGKGKMLREFQGRRILWINPVPLDMYLYQASSVEILRYMAQKGHSSVLITSRSMNAVRSENPKVRIISVPLRYVPFLSSAMFAISLFLFLPLYLVVLDPHFIIVTQPEVSLLGFMPSLLFSKMRKIRSLLDVRSTPVETAGFRGFQQKLWFSLSIVVAKKLFDGMTIITPLMRKEICNAYEMDPRNVGIWSSGVNTGLFDPENNTSEGVKLKRELGLSDKFVVFYHGVFTVTRGLKETIESMKILGPDCSKDRKSVV